MPPTTNAAFTQYNVPYLIRRIQQFDPTFQYNSIGRPGSHYTQADVNALGKYLQNAVSAGYCGPGASNPRPNYDLSGTNLRHANDTTRTGAMARTFLNTPNSLASEIMQTGPGQRDPQGGTGMRWDANGMLNGSPGTWELLITPGGTIQHFNFTN